MKRFFYLTSLFTLLFLVSCGPDPEKSRMYFNKGIDYHYATMHDKAIEYFEKAIKTDRNNYEAYYYLGCSYFDSNRKDDAKNCWLKSIEIKPDYADGYFSLGLLYKMDDDHEMACYYFKQAEKFGRNSMEDYTKFCD